MPRRRRTVLRRGVAVLTGVGLAGCSSSQTGDQGGDSDDEDEPEEDDAGEQGPEPTDSPTATERTTTTQVDLDEIPIGSILPLSGPLGPFGPGMETAVEIATRDVNEAGGPLGVEIELYTRDSQTKPTHAKKVYETLVDEKGIVGFVGAATSGVSVPLAEQVASDGVMQVTNASTTPQFADIGYGDDGEPPKFAGRTAPNDGQQGITMGKVLNDYVDADSAAFLYINNAYGRAIAEKAKQEFDGETLQLVGYDKPTADYRSTLDELHQGNPDGIGFVGYPNNGKTILEQWSLGDYGTESDDWILSKGLNYDEFLETVSSIVEGMYIASPNPQSTSGAETFQKKIGDENVLFAPHAYDALFIQALAIQRAGEVSGRAIAENLQAVATGDGTEVTVGEFGKAKEILASGGEVNYQGASSPLVMTEQLEPLYPMNVLQVQSGGERTTRETIPRSFFRGKL